MNDNVMIKKYIIISIALCRLHNELLPHHARDTCNKLSDHLISLQMLAKFECDGYLSAVNVSKKLTTIKITCPFLFTFFFNYLERI